MNIHINALMFLLYCFCYIALVFSSLSFGNDHSNISTLSHQVNNLRFRFTFWKTESSGNMNSRRQWPSVKSEIVTRHFRIIPLPWQHWNISTLFSSQKSDCPPTTFFVNLKYYVSNGCTIFSACCSLHLEFREFSFLSTMLTMNQVKIRIVNVPF